MSHERIIVIGNGGSGKSTLSRALGEKLKLPVVHLDQIFWKAGWVTISKEDFDRLLAQELNNERWIIDGNYNRTLPIRMERCDAIIYLDLPRIVSFFGAIKRVIQNYGKSRPDMPEGCYERFDGEFLRWVWNFNRENRKKYLKMLQETKDKEVYILHNRREVRRFLESIE